jgi:hypothetical protein
MKVVIFDEGFIPGLGRGPFRTPIEISEDKFFLYKRMGIQVIKADVTAPIAESGVFNRTVTKSISDNIPNEEPEVVEEVKPVVKETKVEETKIEEPAVEEVAVEAANDSEVDEVIEEAVEEEVVITDLTKKELVDLLHENGIEEASKNMTKDELVKLAEESLQ